MLNIFDHTCWGFSTCTITCTHCEQKKVTNKRKILGCMAFSKLSWYSVLFPFPPPLSSFPVHDIDGTSHIPVGLHVPNFSGTIQKATLNSETLRSSQSNEKKLSLFSLMTTHKGWFSHFWSISTIQTLKIFHQHYVIKCRWTVVKWTDIIKTCN